MKKQLTLALLGSFLAIVQPAFLKAQEKDLMAYHSRAYFSGTITRPVWEAASYKDFTGVYVRAKVMRMFLDVFPDAKNVRWNLENNLYLASFQCEGRQYRALFHTSGSLLYTLRSGNEKHLPRDVRRNLRLQYPDYTIGTVSEMDANNKKSWIANLADRDNLIVVRIVEGSLEELQRFKTHF